MSLRLKRNWYPKLLNFSKILFPNRRDSEKPKTKTYNIDVAIHEPGHVFTKEESDYLRAKQAKALKKTLAKKEKREKATARAKKKRTKAQEKWSKAREKENIAYKKQILAERKARAWARTQEIWAKNRILHWGNYRVIVTHRPGYWLTHKRNY